MMQQPHKQPVQIDQIPLLTPGSAKLSIFAHQWAFPRLDIPCLDLQGEVLQGEEAAADPQEEEAVVDSQAVEDPYKAIYKEDHQEIDL